MKNGQGAPGRAAISNKGLLLQGKKKNISQLLGDVSLKVEEFPAITIQVFPGLSGIGLPSA